ncbi:MAG: sugar ABC transporter permease [bacterium]|nr:sugar ABC transporter permease [bacterium]
MISKNTFSTRFQRTDWEAYIFIFPLMAIIGVFIVYSIVLMGANSFFKVDITFARGEFVGWQYYKIALQDKYLYKAIFNTLVFAVSSVLIGLSVGFLFSVFLSFSFRGAKFFRTLFFVPTLLPNAMIAAIFGGMLRYRFGTLNEFLGFFNIPPVRWLSDPTLAYFSVMMIGIYMIGIPMMYYQAELATSNRSMYEAATIDGAGFWAITLKIIFPSVIHSHKTIIMTLMLTSFRAFERVYLLTDGGPGRATEITGTYLYTFFTEGAGTNIGFVNAVSVLILLLAFFLSAIILKFFSVKES